MSFQRDYGGYLPLSVVLSSDAVYQAFLDERLARGFLHSHSYTGNPLACLAALATLDIFASDNVITANRADCCRVDRFCFALWRNILGALCAVRGMIWAADVDTADPGFDAALPRGFGAGVAAAFGSYAVHHAAVHCHAG